MDLEQQVIVMETQLSQFDSLLDKAFYLKEFFGDHLMFSEEARGIVLSNIARQLKPQTGNKIMNEEHLENEIQAKGSTAPRITLPRLEEVIKGEQYHLFEGTQLTVCCLTLENGFTVLGESACASPENFNAELGRKIARDSAKNKIWQLEGYLLKQKLFESNS